MDVTGDDSGLHILFQVEERGGKTGAEGGLHRPMLLLAEGDISMVDLRLYRISRCCTLMDGDV